MDLPRQCFARRWRLVFAAAALALTSLPAHAIHTFGGTDDCSRIEVTAVYFLPKGRAPLPDWKERLAYFAARMEAFHNREYAGQSVARVAVWPQPFVSELTSERIRSDDPNAVFYTILGDIRARLGKPVATNAFPIYLAFSDINWQVLDDFTRVHRETNGVPVHEGHIGGDGRHHPGAKSGGARASYLPHEHCGIGLVSADGWRVPYNGSDCVAYHEGMGHTTGLPHPDPINDSVMGTAQYRFPLNATWLDDDQKLKMGWAKPAQPPDLSRDLFTRFSALHEPAAPVTGQEVRVRFTWPEGAEIARLSIEVQTALFGPWHAVPLARLDRPDSASLGSFAGATPVSYRVRVTLRDGQQTAYWGYFQVSDPARRAFWYDYAYDQEPKRFWARLSPGLWRETYQNGKETLFREGDAAQVDGRKGIVVRRLPDEQLSVWIPERRTKNPQVLFKNAGEPSWHALGDLHEIDIAVPVD